MITHENDRLVFSFLGLAWFGVGFKIYEMILTGSPNKSLILMIFS